MIIVFAEEQMIPGRRLELLAAHDRVGELLRDQQGYVGGRLLHFAGGGYRYIYEMNFSEWQDFEEFLASPNFTGMHERIDPHLAIPFGLQVHVEKVVHVP